MELEKTQFRKERLRAAAKKAGSQSALGKLLGYVDGSPIGQMLRDERPISEQTIEKIEALDGFSYWFSSPGRWPFSVELAQLVTKLDPDELRRAENVLRVHLGMDTLPKPSPGGSGKTGTYD